MIKMVVFDFDGVFTDGSIYFDNFDNIIKYYNVKDGKGLSILKKNNIIIGLISNFDSKLNLKINNKSLENIIRHLNFDFWHIGKGDKIKILDGWLDKLENINYENVAYIGDDLNDLSIIRKVKFSACPNDAINDVKNNVDYICKLKGGKGCVREFIDYLLKKNENCLINNIKNNINDNFNYSINNFNFSEIKNLSEIILNYDKVYFMGIGKSGNQAKHCSDLLKCISINAYYLDNSNILHGDIGIINKDLIIIFSNSGNTKEIIDLIPSLRIKNSYIVSVVCNKNSKMEKLSDKTIILPFMKEIEGNIDKIPTNSCMVQLIFSNILVSILKENINIDSYKFNHPNGNIGKDLSKVKDNLILDFPKFILKDNIKLHDIFLEMTKYKIGCSFFVDNKDNIIGILTDGDIRRLLIKDENKKFINRDDLTTSYIFENDENSKMIKYKEHKGFTPLIKNKKILGIFRY